MCSGVYCWFLKKLLHSVGGPVTNLAIYQLEIDKGHINCRNEFVILTFRSSALRYSTGRHFVVKLKWLMLDSAALLTCYVSNVPNKNVLYVQVMIQHVLHCSLDGSLGKKLKELFTKASVWDRCGRDITCGNS